MMKKMEIKFSDYKQKDKIYVRARANVVLLNGENKRVEGIGKSRVDAKNNLLINIERQNQIFKNRSTLANPVCTLYDAVLNLIHERSEEVDRDRGREVRREVSIQRDYDVCNSLLKPFSISNKALDLITFEDLHRYRKELAAAQYDKKRTKKDHKPEMVFYSASSLNRIIRLVTKVIDEYCLYQNIKSPSEILLPFKQRKTEKTEEDFLIGNEVKEAITYFRSKREEAKYFLDPTYADLFISGIYIGARPGEMRGLKKRDWNPELKELSIKRTAAYEDGRTKTISSIRKIVVPSEAEDIMNRRCKGIKNDDLIFAGIKGTTLSPSNCNKKLKRWLAEAGINKPKVHSHSLRGTCGTVLLDAGVSMDAVSKLLGHDSISTTEAYYSTYTEARRKADAKQICKVFDEL